MKFDWRYDVANNNDLVTKVTFTQSDIERVHLSLPEGPLLDAVRTVPSTPAGFLSQLASIASWLERIGDRTPEQMRELLSAEYGIDGPSE